jgi:hypothetical protein
LKRVLVPTSGASDWRKFLADPQTQWVRTYSAFEAAISWESAQNSERGIPLEIAVALDQHAALAGARLLLALPEHKVRLEGRGKASQTDVWTLLRAEDGYVSMAVEAKAGEPFASTVGEWLKDASDGKKARLEYLCRCLEMSYPPDEALRYQLFHRTVSALLEADRFGASQAVMVVQSFRADPQSWSDFRMFCGALGVAPVEGQLVEVPRTGGLRLYVGWVSSPAATDAVVAAVV